MQDREIFDRLNRAYFSAERHERGVVDHLPELLAGAETFVDVGASLGQYTFFANKCMRGARIFAIEADPIRFEELRRNCEKWHAEGDNSLTAIHAAVSDASGEIVFHTTHSDVSGGLFPHPVSQPGVDWTEIRVPSLTLDELFEGQAPDVVKIDVEGAELRVLQGARALLRESAAKWLIEIHGWSDPGSDASPDEIYSFMASFGYHHSLFHGQDLFARQAPPPIARAHAGLWRLLRRVARRLRG